MLANLLKKLIPKNFASILGVVQTIIPIARELTMVVIRLLAVIMPGKVDDELVAKVKSIADKTESGFDKVKRVLLGLSV